jgi:hypothetical protein
VSTRDAQFMAGKSQFEISKGVPAARTLEQEKRSREYLSLFKNEIGFQGKET